MYFQAYVSGLSGSVEHMPLICQWFERMYLCCFVALYVQMFVAGANKVEGTMN